MSERQPSEVNSFPLFFSPFFFWGGGGGGGGGEDQSSLEQFSKCVEDHSVKLLCLKDFMSNF